MSLNSSNENKSPKLKKSKNSTEAIVGPRKKDDLNLDLEDQSELSIAFGTKKTEVGDGFKVITDQGVDESGNTIVDIDVDADLKGFTVDADLTAASTNTEISKEAQRVLKDIQKYSEKINAENFAERGSLNDYQELFTKVYEYRETFTDHKIDLNVDMGKLGDFAEAAKGLTTLVADLTLQLKSVITVNDMGFLKEFRDRIETISKLYDTIAEFKTTIIATSKLEVPLSVGEVAKILQQITEEINSTMDYLDYFTGITDSSKAPSEAMMSAEATTAIDKAIQALDTWKALADAQTQTGMDTDAQVQEIKLEIQKFNRYAARAEAQVSTLVQRINDMGGHIQFQ